MVNLDYLSRAVIEGDNEKAYELTGQALEAGIPADKILNNALVPGLKEVGDRFERGEFYLPELIVAGDAVAKALELLEPILAQGDKPNVGKFLIGTVQGDVHDLGKNIVIMMLKGNGWEVTDLGVDISAEAFCDAASQGDYDVIGISALLTMTMPTVAKAIADLEARGLRDKVKVMVGGAPTTQKWADEIGADGWAKDGPAAAKAAAALIGKA
jgi:5-methyltetrahydrofolate--homocysteine methyltransferase